MKKPTKPVKKPEKERMKKISIRIPDDVHLAIKNLSAEFKVSMAAVVRCILTLFILKAMKAHPKLISPGETLAGNRKKWAQYIIPELEKHWMESFKKRK